MKVPEKEATIDLDLSQDENEIAISSNINGKSSKVTYTAFSLLLQNSIFLEYQSLEELQRLLKKLITKNYFKVSKDFKSVKFLFPVRIPLAAQDSLNVLSQKSQIKAFKDELSKYKRIKNNAFEMINQIKEEIKKIQKKIEKKFDFSGVDFSKFQCESVIKPHQQDKVSINSLCLTHNGRIASSFSDKTIRVYNPITYECDIIIKGHKDSVLFLSLLNNGYLVSSSEDKAIKVWEIGKRHYQCIKTLVGHRDGVSKVVELSSGRIGSCSFREIRIWSISPYNFLEALYGHLSSVNSIIELTNTNYIVSGGDGEDETLRFWNSLDYKCEISISKVPCAYSGGITEAGEFLLVGGYEKVSIIGLITLQLENIIEFHHDTGYITSILYLSKEHILCGCNEGILFDINLNKRKAVMIGKPHLGLITSLIPIGKGKISSCSWDDSIKIWNC